MTVIAGGKVRSGEGLLGSYAAGANGNRAVVSGPGSLWTNSAYLYVGDFGTGNQLIVSNGGLVAAGVDGIVGLKSTASNNVAVVTGTGSLWTNKFNLYVGYLATGNRLVVTNGGVVANSYSSIGFTSESSNNLTVVTGAGSRLSNSIGLTVGYSGSGNQLLVSDGGLVAGDFGYIGQDTGANNNLAVVTGAGSVWTNSSSLAVGNYGNGNQLVVTNGGTIQAVNVHVGLNASSSNNRATVDGGSLIVTNSGGTGTLDIRRGTNVLNAGLIQTDNLLLENSAGLFEFNGGTLITRGGTVDNGQDFVVGASGTTTAVLNLLTNAPLALKNDFILGANNAAGNQLLLTNGGVLSCSGVSSIGLTASNNLVVVDGTGSSWTNSGNLLLGNNSAGNRLTVGGGGVVANAFGILGNTSVANNNLAWVTGVGSLWNNSSSVSVGYSGSGNQLVVSNGAVVVSSSGNVGIDTTASNNLAVVTGPGSLWSNTGDIAVGSSGKWNRLVVSDSGTVQAANAYVGANSTGNRVTVSGGNLVITNSGGTGTLNILRGTNVLNAGLIQTDNLQVNNGALSQFEFNGGTLITGGGTVNNSQPFVVGASGSTAAILNVRSNTPLTLNNGLTLGANTAAAGNQLLLTNGGTLSVTGNSSVGDNASAFNNLAVISGTGSLWMNSGDALVGNNGSSNQLVVSDGGRVANISGVVGNNSTASNNVAVVTGTDSLWTNSADIYVGFDGTGNRLVVSNGGIVVSSLGALGVFSTSIGNVAVVTDTGSFWTNRNDLFVGYYGTGNQLVVSNGGTVQAAIASVGLNASSINNRVSVDGGNLVTGTLDIRRGTNVLNAGLIVADKLLLTNSAGFFDFNGGTLITRGGTVNNGQAFVVGASGTTAAILNVQSNAPLTLNNSFTLGANTAAAGNRLLLTNGGTLSVTVSSFVGANSTASNNLAIVSGAGSRWISSDYFLVGLFGSGNQLVVSDGGTVAGNIGSVGDKAGADNNVAVVTGPGSLWTNSSSFAVGYNGSGNQLVVSNGGLVVNDLCNVGNTSIANSNLVVVTGPGSLWINRGNLYVGNFGGGNQLMVSDGGTVQASNAYVGFQTGSTNNRVTMDGGTVTVTGSLTINSNNMLAGVGTMNGTMTNFGSLAPGNPIGKLVLNNSPVLQGSVLMEISKTGGFPTNDQIQVAASLTYGGNLVVSKFGAQDMTAGDSFTLFSATNYGGAFTNVILPPLTSSLMWTNKLLLDGSIAVVQRPPPTISGVVQSGTNLVFTLSGGAPGGTYTLLTSTNVVLPLSAWATNSAGFFDALGGITITRGINPDETERYYNVRVP